MKSFALLPLGTQTICGFPAGFTCTSLRPSRSLVKFANTALPSKAFGCNITSTLSLNCEAKAHHPVFDVAGNIIGVFVATKEGEFFGMRYGGGIGGIAVSFSGFLPDTGYFTVDDLQFGPVPSPTVAIDKIGGGKIVANWPAYYGAYQLQVTHHVNKRRPEKTNWKNVTTVPVTNPIGQGKFFRIVPQ